MSRVVLASRADKRINGCVYTLGIEIYGSSFARIDPVDRETRHPFCRVLGASTFSRFTRHVPRIKKLNTFWIWKKRRGNVSLEISLRKGWLLNRVRKLVAFERYDNVSYKTRRWWIESGWTRVCWTLLLLVICTNIKYQLSRVKGEDERGCCDWL